MSRLYGRTFDLFQTSNSVLYAEIPKYKFDTHKISPGELVSTTHVTDDYLPKEVLEYFDKHPIQILKSPFISRNRTQLPSEEKPEAIIEFKGFNFKKEHKRELAFFIGSIMSDAHPDELPKKDNLPCEYGDLLSLLIEYLYLKNTHQDDKFVLRHLHEIKELAYIYANKYEEHQKHIVNDTDNDSKFIADGSIESVFNENDKKERAFLANALVTLIPFSSFDGVLQIIDRVKTEKEIKELIQLLYENPGSNRQVLLQDYGVESFGYKRLRKEMDYWSC